MNKRVLILYTSVGLGHKSIAENIAYHMSQRGCAVRLEDVYQVEESPFLTVGKAVHAFINKYMTFVWSFLYYITNTRAFSPLLPLRVSVAKKNSERTLSVVQEFQPDIVITTQAAASGIMAYLKKAKLYNGRWGVAFSDYHLHQFWLYEGADFYLVNTKEQKKEMKLLGETAPAYVCGIVLQPQVPVNVQEVKMRLNIPPDKKVVLVGSGSIGINLNESVFPILRALPNIHALVVCGKNEQLAQRLRQELEPDRFTVLGFYSPMEELYAVADLFLTKPGGLSVAEALRNFLPIVVTYTLPGQEKLNLEYLRGKALVMPEGASRETVEQELYTGSFKRHIQASPHVAEIVSAQGFFEWMDSEGIKP